MIGPELGQLAFSNGEFYEYDLQRFIERDLSDLSERVVISRGGNPDTDWGPAENSGCEPFESEVFSIRCYCWCEGSVAGHEDGCPPNFEHRSGFKVTWYKYLGRGSTQNAPITRAQWDAIYNDCRSFLHYGNHVSPAAPPRPAEEAGGGV